MSIGNPTAGTISWFARHELNLSWRDFMRMMSAGKAGREKPVIGFMIISVLVVHAIAYSVLKPAIDGGLAIDKGLLSAITGSIILTFSLMMSQAIELVTRVFYSRSDLDLILSSPVSARKLFTVRIGAIATSTTMLSLLLFGAAINIMALFHSAWWLSAYLMVAACGAIATALSLIITVFMFDTLGAKTTRLVSQIIAAVVGATFIIGIQLAAISSLGSISRFEFLTSDFMTQNVPEIGSYFWIPAHAVMGEVKSLLIALITAFTLLLISISAFAGNFGERVILAAGISQNKTGGKRQAVSFRSKSTATGLRHKEWKLLLRDHWLISQTLMQILYLIPPAFMLWQGFGSAGALSVVAIPALVMASGQLAGGLAWLAISGEDAPQLVETAPIAKGAITRAKVEAVLGAIAVITVPILIILAWYDLRGALIAALGIGISTISATMIQLWFRSQAKRSNFRRRQTSSKVATLAEAFSSILWAGTIGLLAAGSTGLALIPAVLAIGVLWIACSFRPVQEI